MKILLNILILITVALTAYIRPALAHIEYSTPESRAINVLHKEMFASGNFAPLDKEMNEIQRAFENGRIKDWELEHFFNAPFAGADSQFETRYNNWIAQFPKSYAAIEARGQYYLQMAAIIQNQDKKLPRRSSQNKEALKNYLDLALADCTAATKLTGKPILSYTLIMHINMLSDSPEKSRAMLDKADEIAPDNTTARTQYMVDLINANSSVEQIEKFLNEIHDVSMDEDIWRRFANNLNYTLFLKGQYGKLDKMLNQTQKDYEAGKLDDISLSDYFSFFEDDTNPDHETKYNEWVKAYPQSYAAYQARALYFTKVAERARGEKYAAKTSTGEMSGMEHYMSTALGDDKAAMALSAKPLLAVENIMTVMQFSGSRQVCDQMMAMANKMDPKNSIVRSRYMATLQTRWGGSLKEMEEFLKESKDAGINPSTIANFEDRILTEKLWLADQYVDAYSNIGQTQAGF